MSFQGDVRGIGLAELLQGLARGRKVGTLTLTSTSGARATMGLEEGLAYLLPESGEDAEIWRTRVRDAWADDPNFRVDYLRMSEVAKAARLEQLYILLDGGGVHFRFDPGELPDRSGDSEETAVFCDGMQVEFLLLEYARIHDELEGAAGAMGLSSDVIPVLLDPNLAADVPPRLIENCNGTSTLSEIGARVGWPLRQACLQTWRALKVGAISLAAPSEYLRLAIVELGRKNFSRAATRLSAWCRDGQPGPLDAEGAETLANEWVSGRLSAALKGMLARDVRTLLRRLDHSLRNPSAAVVHWIEASRLNKTDRIMRMKRMVAEFREGSDPERPSVRELLDLAREFRDGGHPARSGPLLVVVAHLQPESVGQQLEVGTGLVISGRAREGAPWILNGCRVLLESGDADRAVGPLRALLEADPRNRECRQLLSRARRESTHAKKLRKQLLIGLAIVSLLSLGAVAKVHRDRLFQDRLADVRSLLHDPDAALERMEELFPDDNSVEVHALAQQIEDRQRMHQIRQRDAWNDLYQEAQVECARGDPLLALDKITALPLHPDLPLVRPQWPLKHDLYATLVKHLEAGIELLGPPKVSVPSQIQREGMIADQIAMIERLVERPEQNDPDLISFLEGLDTVSDLIERRRDERDRLTEERLREKNLQEQERLFQLAKQHTDNGEFERALRAYEDILALDKAGRLRKVIEPLMKEVREKMEAVNRARSLSYEGKHDEAFAVLSEALDEPGGFMMPWKVESFPPGVKVETSGRIYTTPFEIWSTFGEQMTMTVSMEGYEKQVLDIDRPSDLFLHMSRVPERSWRGEGRIDAVPVAIGNSHIVVDRRGNLARISAGGEMQWNGTKRIETLSGIARAPVFMPARPESLLLVTEDGDAWILDAASGKIEGPRNLGSAPSVGPAPGAGEVLLRLHDGRVARWKDALRPVVGFDPANVGADGDYRFGSNSGMQVLRRRANEGARLSCRWNDWVVEVDEGVIYVYQEGQPDDVGYSVVREGEWTYVAWEQPLLDAPSGRLWVADGAGLRAFVPLP